MPVAEQISDRAFHELDLRTTPRDQPEPEPRSPEHSARWIARTLRFLEHDPGGCWVAEDADGVAGFATSLVRERVWCLATYAVRPGLQGRGVGARLLEAAESHGDDCETGMLAASTDPRAVRRYWRAGFTLHPQVQLQGRVDRSRLRGADGVRAGGPDDRELADEVARRLRGGGHGPDHESLAGLGRMLVAEDRTGLGFAYADDARLHLLAATHPVTAQALLWECLAGAGAGVHRPARDGGEPVGGRRRADRGGSRCDPRATSACAEWTRRRRTFTTVPCCDHAATGHPPSVTAGCAANRCPGRPRNRIQP
ncbi:GNAT family N-acetyltransferase [Nocardioides sp. TF02-7]|uniref:GNAT family N-acetyltransferase n=1 Tax=Nocardioides sp. TF02-7 TaxID=2917724 RepID=UPI001F05C643|nr:GNAT family N-acetyltransferase [Nocardioides sp. TF02-7]UMG92033.1 GNAT family N-acetyltransferase [Nocardioides sp. TF02-7]